MSVTGFASEEKSERDGWIPCSPTVQRPSLTQEPRTPMSWSWMELLTQTVSWTKKWWIRPGCQLLCYINRMYWETTQSIETIYYSLWSVSLRCTKVWKLVTREDLGQTASYKVGCVDVHELPCTDMVHTHASLASSHLFAVLGHFINLKLG